VEHADSLAAPVWTPLPSVLGEGEWVVFTDTNAPPAVRFYRVRVE
jgi:hypothetical protein